MKFHIHKWEYIYERRTSTFLGKDVKKYYPKFRICKKCGKVQQRFYSELNFSWETLDPCKKNILEDAIKKGQFKKETKRKGVCKNGRNK